jgi:hypothetical protein
MVGLVAMGAPPPNPRSRLLDILSHAVRGNAAHRFAIATVAAITATAAAPVVRAVPEVARELGDGWAATLVVIATTSALGVGVARRALRARSDLHARLWLAIGAAGAGALATLLSYHGVLLVRGATTSMIELPLQLVGSLVLGGVLGFLFGTAFAPVVQAARRAARAPSHDGHDRVAFAGGASLVVVGVGRVLLATEPGVDLVGCAVAAVGALAMAVATARVVLRARLIERARRGAEPGFHLVPVSGREDEAALVPLVRARSRPSGVLAATGVSAPYRGARGVFKIGLVPLPEEPLERPIASVLGEVMAEGASCFVTLAIGVVALMMAAPFACLLAVASSL